MKKSYSIILAAFSAALLSVSSCSYMEEMGIVNKKGTDEPVARTITLSYPQTTKTTLDGLQPKWTEGDEILLADGTGTETITVTKAQEGVAFEFTTTLQNQITAVYPKDAAVISGNTINGIKVSATQDGTFANANICKAVEEGSDLKFKNQTAIIKVNVPAATKQLTVTSLNPINSATGQRASDGAAAIADAEATVITVGNGESNIANPCYVSVLPGAVLADLNFDVDGKAQGGFSPNSIKAAGKDPSSYTVKANQFHTLAASSLHEYVTVDGKKWATKNIGAESSTDAGLYFMWGVTTGIAPTDTNAAKFAFPDAKYYSADNSTWDSLIGFEWQNCPYTNGVYNIFSTKNVFTKYTGSENAYAKSGTADGKTVLDLCDDAANANWGGSWRMPTKEEYDALLTATETTKSNFSDGVLTINDHSDLTFPATGWGAGTGLYDVSNGSYWTSSLAAGVPNNACSFLFPGDVRTSGSIRYAGYSVRAISD